MANKHISQLPAATIMNDGDLLVCEQGGVAKRLTGSILMAMINSHGGITGTSYTPPVAPSLQGTLTLTFTDGTSFNVPIMNGAKGDTGEQGEQGERGAAFTYEDFTPEQLESLRGEQGVQGIPGNPGYVHIKWASVEPTSDADMSDVPDAWMGIYSGSSSTAPTAYTAYAWYEIKGDTGAAGADGSRGSYIWRLRNLPTAGNNNWTIPASDLIPPPFDSEAEVRGGDLAFYGDVYYCFTGEIITGGYELVGETYINSAALPEAGTTGQVLAKLSNNSYDVGWVDQTGGDGNIFWAEYNVTTLAELQEHIADGDVVLLNYNNFIYRAVRSTTTFVDFACVDRSLVKIAVVTASSWSSYSIDIPSESAYIKKPSNPPSSGDYLRYINGEWVAASGGGGVTDYSALTNKPSINSVTLSGNKTAADLNLASASDLAAKYTKPSGGIPKTDLASAVQTSLGKADSALQSVPSTYRTAAAQDTIDAGKEDKITEVTISTAGAVTQALDAGKIYHFTGALTSLTVTLNAAAAGQLAQYHFDFDCGSTAPTVTIPNTVTMPDGNSFEANKHYEVDILNNFGAVLSWANS